MRPTLFTPLNAPVTNSRRLDAKDAPSDKPVIPEAPTGPLAELAALRRRAHEPRGIVERRDDAAVATVVQGLKQSLDPDEGVKLIHDAIKGQIEARQAEILAECATQLRSLRALPIVRQRALIALLAAAEKIQSERPAALDAAVIALETEGRKGMGTRGLKDLLDKARNLPDEYRGKTIATIGAQLLRADNLGDSPLRIHLFLEAAAEVKTHRPKLLESLVETAQEGEQALLAREQRLLARSGSLRTSLLEGGVSCREVAAEHGIVVDHLHKLAWSSAQSRVRDGENLVDVLQTVDVDIGLRMQLNDIALNRAQQAIHKHGEPASVIEQLGIHDPDDITGLIQKSVRQLRAKGVSTVPDLMQKLGFQDPRYARLAAKCVEDLVD